MILHSLLYVSTQDGKVTALDRALGILNGCKKVECVDEIIGHDFMEHT